MSSSVPVNIPYMLTLIAKNILSKVDINKLDLDELAEGKPIPLPRFKVLDVGLGFGKWGFLIRDTFDVMMGQNFNKGDWKINVTGVETFDKCVTKIQKELYNEIIDQDIMEVIDTLGRFDLIIMGDVIEHFEKSEAKLLLNKLLKHSDNILISTPNGMMPQGAWAGNEREVHKSGWTIKDFKKYNVIEYRILKDEMTAVLMEGFKMPPIELLALWIKN